MSYVQLFIDAVHSVRFKTHELHAEINIFTVAITTCELQRAPFHGRMDGRKIHGPTYPILKTHHS